MRLERSTGVSRITASLFLIVCVFATSSCMSLAGNSGLTVSGNSSTNVVTVGLDGSVARQVDADSGTAVPSGNVFSILGSGNVTTTGSGSVITIGGSGGPPGPQGPQGETGLTGDPGLKGDNGVATFLGDMGNATPSTGGSFGLYGSGSVSTVCTGSYCDFIGAESVAYATTAGNATYSTTAGTAADSDRLDGQHGSHYLTTTGTAADSTLFYGFTAIQWTNAMDAIAAAATSADSDKLDGLHGASYGTTLSIVHSSTVRNSNDTEKTTLSTSYVKKKEIKINAALADVTIYAEIKRTPNATTYYTVYKNGSPIGAEHTTATDSSYHGFSDTLTGFASGDLIQIYLKTSLGTATSYVQNMRLEYSYSISGIGGNTLLTMLPVTTDPTISVTNQDP